MSDKTRRAALDKIEKAIEVALSRLEKCGGPGSGIPGPCPSSSSSSKPAAKPRRPAARKPPKAKPARKPKKGDEKPSVEAVMRGTQLTVAASLRKINAARASILKNAQKLGFKPTSKDKWINEQQAIEFVELRAAKKMAGATQPTKISEKPPAKPAAKPAAGSAKPPKTKPEESAKPAAKPAVKPPKPPAFTPEEQAAALAKVEPWRPGARTGGEGLTSNESMARAIVAMAGIKNNREVNHKLPAFKKLTAKSTPKEVMKAMTGQKANDVWPNRLAAAKAAIKTIRENFNDEGGERVIQAGAAAVKQFFSKDGGAARILTALRKEFPW